MMTADSTETEHRAQSTSQSTYLQLSVLALNFVLRDDDDDDDDELQIFRGHSDCLICAREHGCPWDSNTCLTAAREGHLDCLIWARKHGCPWNPVQCRITATHNNRHNILDWMSSIGL